MIQIPKEKTKDMKNITPSKHTFLITSTNDCLKLDKSKINFCKYPIFASSFKQINLSIEVMDYFPEHQRKEFYLLRVKTLVTKIDQKVFTVKAVENGEEVVELEIPIKVEEPIQLIIRATIPELEISTDINGSLSVQIDEFPPLLVPIIARGEVPQIVCLKEMQNLKTGVKVIKIPSKSIMKIPFKNCSNINFFFEVKLVTKDLDKSDDGVKLKIIPNQPMTKFQEQKNKAKDNIIIKVDANSAFCITLQFQLLLKDNSIRVARRILVLQVQGTKLLFPFPLEVIISE